MSKSKSDKCTIKNRIMQAVSEIPFGKTINYSELAKRVGLKGRERYVSTFLKQNPYLIAVPCHRVIRKNGDTGNYILGKKFKKYLLGWEKSFL
jgi:methylated-DNA-[protein]-cysteine S-methyltransferase